MKSNSSPYGMIWIIASVIAAVPALHMVSAAFVDGSYIPAGNDSFYHARRIIDVATGARDFYQFDPMIHVPDGSWLNWPWAYDYLLAKLTALALLIMPALEPMTFLAHVPVAWLVINFGLLTLVARDMGLTPPYAAAAVVGFALLPLTQTLHGVGSVDHHFIELTFVLATIWCGLRFFERGDRNTAIWLGIVLGIAPAFHNGLFILQLPVAATLLVLWLQNSYPEKNNLLVFAASLIVATIMILLPSVPFREFQFEFWTLSWFHLYLAACTALGATALCWIRNDNRGLGILAAMVIVMAAPLYARLSTGAQFLAGDLILLEHIHEVRSPFEILSDPGGLTWVGSYYSWLFFLSPILLVVAAMRLGRNLAPAASFLAIFVLGGILLMFVQYRLHPFGAWAYFLLPALLAQEWQQDNDQPRSIALGAFIVALVIGLQAPIQNRLLVRYPPGLSVDYAIAMPIFDALSAACKQRPGAVLSYNDDGHYVRYHTDCSVMTNNFLLTPLHERKIREADELLQMTPAEFLTANPGIDYLLVRMYGAFDATPDGSTLASPAAVAAQNAPLFSALTFASATPEGFEKVDEIRVRDDRDFAYVSVYRLPESQSR